MAKATTDIKIAINSLNAVKEATEYLIYIEKLFPDIIFESDIIEKLVDRLVVYNSPNSPGASNG